MTFASTSKKIKMVVSEMLFDTEGYATEKRQSSLILQ